MHDGSGPGQLLAVFCANVIHIAPWRVAEGLFAGAGALSAAPTGGCFSTGRSSATASTPRSAMPCSTRSLRERDAEWGVRDIADLEKLAASVGLALIEIVEMPANNLILVFERPKSA